MSDRFFPMTFNEYQHKSGNTAVYPGSEPQNHGSREGLAYCTLGLTGEAGECAELIKKHLRGDDGPVDVISPERRLKLLKELGDVLWYTAQLARQAGISLQEVADENLVKLAARKAVGTLLGAGDDR